ncbi:PREDICTED: junctional protein associated with coronary artery disease [Elephantulus edwardii]|uniref:junctional protein associated with coronary artery disease n=1 Tax=Elephantulus edwardii TaxID=28737 RepID=UPI0003F0AD66|nr:PREDICTED: junctional protein associated with coronary artery disease [Elephantulus edwardii]
MYSVEDLLISHGYKLSRNMPAPRKDNHEQPQPERTRTRAGHGMLNGYENDPAAFAQSKKALRKGCVSDSESRRGTPRSHGEPPSSAFRTSEVGFYNQPPLAWSSQPHTGNDQACWRRKGQESSGLSYPRDREDLEVRRLAQAHSRPGHWREGPWEVSARTENVTKKAAVEDELRMPGTAKWQHVSLENWSQPRKLGRQMSDGGGEKLFQDPYSLVPGEHALNPQNKGKSQSLPRVLFPESLSCMEMPVSLNDGHLPGVPKMPLYPPNCTPNLESTRSTEKGGLTPPFPQPKFGRPLKPPSYETHQQSRGGVDGCEHQDSHPADDPYASYWTKPGDPQQEHCGSDSSLEPPVYVPPPSYHSSSPHITNPYLEDTSRAACGSRSQQHPQAEKASTSCQGSATSLGTGDRLRVSPGSPRGLPQDSCPSPTRDSSVQYIPFDDPHIRHIKLTHPQGYFKDPKLYDRPYSTAAPHEPAPRKMEPGSAFLSTTAVAPAISDPNPRWLPSHPLREGDPWGSADQRDSHAERGQRLSTKGAQRGQSVGPTPSPNPPAQGTCETITQLKQFETGLLTKKSSKKKKSGTVFCLVSIPVKPEPHLPELDRNNNDLKQGADKKSGLDKSPELQEQSLLSTSSTDLELQALTGSMACGAQPGKQELGEARDKQTNDLRCSPPVRHRGLKGSGPWPGYQLRDQQTQTSFNEEAKSSELPSGVKPGGPENPVLTPGYYSSTASDQPTHTAPAPVDQRQRPSAHHLKGQMYLNLSSNSAFSRTPSGVSQAPESKAHPPQPHLGGLGHAANPAPKDEVVKGEPTSPCNTQQLFGQFLLKPVGRRPWDLISQLENFNKELQEQKDSSGSGSEGSSEEREGEEQDDSTDSRWKGAGFGSSSLVVTGEQQPTMPVLEEPGFRSGGVNSKSENWSEEQKAGPLPLGFQQAEDSRGDPFRLADGNWITEKRNQEVGTRQSKLAVSLGPVKRRTAFKLSDTKPAAPFSPSELREPWERQIFTEDAPSVKPREGAAPEAESGDNEDMGFLLSLANKNRGLSAPDLRSMGLPTRPEQGTNEIDGILEKVSALEIPPNESLQERAERILGIEVAVESLLQANKRAGHNPRPESGESAFRTESPREEPLTSTVQRDGPAVTKDAFYGRRKCGWTESPLFVGERDITRRTPCDSAHSGMDGDSTNDTSRPEPPSSPQVPRCMDHRDLETKPAFRSTLFHFVERIPGPEKRGRSTSNVIESLQEKLASPPQRADSDRLMRMREVSSVSRMRLLISSRSSESTEEMEDPKVERGQGEQSRSHVSLNGGDLPHRVASLPKNITMLEDSGHLAVQGAWRKGDQDFFCPDSYDPSRVERV